MEMPSVKIEKTMNRADLEVGDDQEFSLGYVWFEIYRLMKYCNWMGAVEVNSSERDKI